MNVARRYLTVHVSMNIVDANMWRLYIIAHGKDYIREDPQLH